MVEQETIGYADLTSGNNRKTSRVPPRKFCSSICMGSIPVRTEANNIHTVSGVFRKPYT